MFMNRFFKNSKTVYYSIQEEANYRVTLHHMKMQFMKMKFMFQKRQKDRRDK